mmetsp:Transcript_9366/g.28334  ORF Transcript_9366/g.28334 Transcript_9366/m.28334 type:complete len:304 (+) Transcript_9366:990-1901(+)
MAYDGDFVAGSSMRCTCVALAPEASFVETSAKSHARGASMGTWHHPAPPLRRPAINAAPASGSSSTENSTGSGRRLSTASGSTAMLLLPFRPHFDASRTTRRSLRALAARQRRFAAAGSRPLWWSTRTGPRTTCAALSRGPPSWPSREHHGAILKFIVVGSAATPSPAASRRAAARSRAGWSVPLFFGVRGAVHASAYARRSAAAQRAAAGDRFNNTAPPWRSYAPRRNTTRPAAASAHSASPPQAAASTNASTTRCVSAAAAPRPSSVASPCASQRSARRTGARAASRSTTFPSGSPGSGHA